MSDNRIDYSKSLRELKTLIMELQKDRFYALIFMVIVIAAIVFGGDFLRAIAPNGFF